MMRALDNFNAKKRFVEWMDGIWVPQNEYLRAARGTQIIVHASARQFNSNLLKWKFYICSGL
jgi:hypothetical protein